MSQIDQMKRAGTTETGYEYQAAPAGLADALQALGWDRSMPVDGYQEYVVTQDCGWQEQFRGTHDGCFSKLLRLQSQSVDWAVTHGGWYIIPAQLWDEVLAARDQAAEVDQGAAPRG
ncbi:hypothetical protein [uncultured Variovorax sp.]|uniref:hypothetical protein n=1 Tax=uncultured Variovorax sp. TaxID=114708 RepID=UPI002619181B|nr:hypothetical protein [uncultured Variovorax sp.]